MSSGNSSSGNPSSSDDSPADAPLGAHTVVSVLRGATQWLSQRGIESPQRSAELMLGHVLGLGRLQLYLEHDRPLEEAERAAMRGLLRRRGEGEPVAHLLGSWSFRGLELAVNKAVLVPRPETEDLVDLALERASDGASIIDLGTGSGAIAIALAVARPDLTVTAVDVSSNALEVARSNAARHGTSERVTFLRGSWWQPVAADARFDLVVSNPPYIDPDAAEGLADDVRKFEPPLALFTAGGDVASCYREIAAGATRHLRSGGFLIAETGVGASCAAAALLRGDVAFEAVQVLPDTAGIDRYLIARRA